MELTRRQKRDIKAAYRRGIIKELYARSRITREEYRRLIIK